MTTSIKLKLLSFAVGALILVIGDYMYGTTYYTDIPTTDPDRFLVSGLLGFITSVLYMYGIFGYAEGFTKKNSIFKTIMLYSLGVFSIGVAVTHSFAAGYMYIFNANLVHPNNPIIETMITQVDRCYNIYFMPCGLAVFIGFTSLFIGIIKNETVFSKKALFFFPLFIVAIISILDSNIENYPIVLKSAACSGIIFNTALLVLGSSSPEQSTS